MFDISELKEKMDNQNIKRLDLLKIEGKATLATSNFGGIIILVNSTGESVFVQEVWDSNFDSNFKEIKEKEIKFDKQGYSYFEYENIEYYLNEFIKRK